MLHLTESGPAAGALAGTLLLLAQAAIQRYLGASVHKNLIPPDGRDIGGLLLAAITLFVAAGGGVGCATAAEHAAANRWTGAIIVMQAKLLLMACVVKSAPERMALRICAWCKHRRGGALLVPMLLIVMSTFAGPSLLSAAARRIFQGQSAHRF